MTSRVVHFEIPVDDSDRAGAFYRDVFGWKIGKFGPVDYWNMTTGAEPGPGAEGALAPPGKMPIPMFGWSAHVRDSEGNLIGLFQADATVPLPVGGMGA